MKVNDPIICIAWLSDTTLLMGLSTGDICVIDVKENQIKNVAKCDSPVVGIYVYNIQEGNNSMTMCIAVDLTSNIYLYNMNDFSSIMTYKLDYRVTCAAFNKGWLALGLAGSMVACCEIE